jgi:hypothetical protein
LGMGAQQSIEIIRFHFTTYHLFLSVRMCFFLSLI